MIEADDSYHLLLEMTPSFYLENLPPALEGKSLTDFLDLAKKTVRDKWADYIVSVFNDLPNTPQKTKLFNIFGSEANLRLILEKEKFRELEMLRLLGEADLWRDIVVAISEREKASIILARNWIDDLSDDQVEKLVLSRNEIILFLDLSLAVQGNIDNAYVHQLELADRPDGKKIGPHAKEFGCEYLYDEKTPYINIFTKEFSGLVTSLEQFSQRIEDETIAGLLPEVYHHLSVFLKKLSENYGSTETNHEKIIENWKEVSRQYISLAQAGCPTILTPWGFLTDGNHVGIELMVTLNLGESSHWYEVSQEYLSLAKDFMESYDPNFKPNPFIHQYVFVRNGINIPWSGTACASDEYIVFYDNENDNFGRTIYQSYFHEFLDSDTSEEHFSRVRGINTVAHETGHLGRMLDEDLYKKMGIGAPINKLDESKADAMANLYFLMKLLRSGSPDVSPAEFIEQYIVDYVDELRSSKGHEKEDIGMVWYGFSAKLCLIKLFESGSIGWSGDRIKILDGLRGVEILAKTGKEIFDLYGDPNFKEKEVLDFVSGIEDQAKNTLDFQRLQKKVDLTKS